MQAANEKEAKLRAIEAILQFIRSVQPPAPVRSMILEKSEINIYKNRVKQRHKATYKGQFEAERKLIPQEEGGVQKYGLKEELKLKFKENVIIKSKWMWWKINSGS